VKVTKIESKLKSLGNERVENKCDGQGRMEGCAGGGQGSKRVVAPLMMMMMMKVTKTNYLKIKELSKMK
jgi:hypothetical protein